MGRFIEAVKKWREWCQENLDRDNERIAFARTMLDGLHQNCNMLFDDNGLAYESRGDHLDCVEREDASDPWSAYRKTGEIKSKFAGYRDDGATQVFKTGPDLQDELVLRSGTFTNCRTWSRSSFGSTLSRCEQMATMSAKGVKLADDILAQAGAIQDWMFHWAKAGDRSKLEVVDMDWTMFCTRLGVPPECHRDIPDCGSVMCALHAELDEMGGHEGARCYCY